MTAGGAGSPRPERLPLAATPPPNHMPLQGRASLGVRAVRRYPRGVPTQQDPRVVLDDIQAKLELNDERLAWLFRLSADELEQWRLRAVPEDRVADVRDSGATVELLDRKLAVGRLGDMAERPVDALGGETLLESLARDPSRTRARYEAAFDTSTTA